jgi:tripartite-type tricarboxylate transporter receptor subunit TctC
LKKKDSNIAVVVLVALILMPACKQRPKGRYPEKNIFVYIFSSQGGGSDRWARHLSALMEKELGVHIVCNNLPGANGGTGAMKVWNAPHDGYTILGASETSMFFGVNDVAPTAEQWEFFIAAGSPGVLAVHSDSPYETVQDLVQAAKNNPNRIKVSNSGQGKLWHIKVMQFEKGSGVEFQHVPYNGSAPAITALLSKEVDAVSCSAEEIVEYVKGDMIRPLIIIDTAGVEFENFGFVKPAAEIYPDTKYGYENLFQWLGFLIPHDVPDEVLEVFGRAFDKAVNHARTDELIKVQKARKIGLRGKEAKEMALRMQSVASWMSKELGIAKKDPVELGISRP